MDKSLFAMSTNLIRLTVRPHVDVYIKKLYGDRILLSDRNPITLLLKSILEYFDKKDPSMVRPSKKTELGGWVEIYISDGMLRRYGGYVNNENIKAFSDAVDLMIKQEMYRWCSHPNAPDQIVDYNIKRFLDYYEFSEDDLTFDNLKRWYYRERERQTKRNVEHVEPDLIIPMMIQECKPNNSQQIPLF